MPYHQKSYYQKGKSVGDPPSGPTFTKVTYVPYQGAAAGVLNAVASVGRGLSSVELPLLGRTDVMIGAFVQGFLGNVIYQYVQQAINVDVFLEETVYDPDLLANTNTNTYVPKALSGALGQLTMASVLTENQTSNAMEGLQGAIVNIAAEMAFPK